MVPYDVSEQARGRKEEAGGRSRCGESDHDPPGTIIHHHGWTRTCLELSQRGIIQEELERVPAVPQEGVGVHNKDALKNLEERKEEEGVGMGGGKRGGESGKNGGVWQKHRMRRW